MMSCSTLSISSFFFNDPATTEIYTLSLHDALPIYVHGNCRITVQIVTGAVAAIEIRAGAADGKIDRKSTRLNSSHGYISYAVFCLKKKTKKAQTNCSVSPCPTANPWPQVHFDSTHS